MGNLIGDLIGNLTGISTIKDQLECYFGELAEICGVSPNCYFLHNYCATETFRIEFEKYRFEGKAFQPEIAQAKAYRKAINQLRRKPLQEFEELVEKHGLTPIYSTKGRIVTVTLSKLKFKGKGPEKEDDKEIAMIKALKYLRTLPLPDTAGTGNDSKELLKSTVRPSTESVLKMATGENKQDTTISSINLGIKDTGEGQTKSAVEDKELSVNQNGPIEIETAGTESVQKMATGENKQDISIASDNKNSLRIKDTGEGLTKSMVENKELSVNEIVPIEIKTAGPLTRPEKQSTETESLKGLADNAVRPRRAGNNATEAVLQEPTASRVQSQATLVKTKIVSVTTDRSETHEYMRQCKELQTRGLREAPKNTADISDPNITVVLHKDEIDNTPVGIQKAGRHVPPEKTCMFSLQFRPIIQFPEELELTSEEKERIVNEAVHDLVHEFQSPQLLREAVLKPEDHQLYDILSEKVAARYNILKEQKQTESPLVDSAVYAPQ